MWNFCLCPVVTEERKDIRHQSSACHEWGWQPRNSSSALLEALSHLGPICLQWDSWACLKPGVPHCVWGTGQGARKLQASPRVGDDAQISALG